MEDLSVSGVGGRRKTCRWVLSVVGGLSVVVGFVIRAEKLGG